ncbi:MAG: hypothetical protein FWD97_02690 [Defluviitaleaceae bacterium]|nr:hypothetical protein [Defluviitaleaceae bacterium]
MKKEKETIENFMNVDKPKTKPEPKGNQEAFIQGDVGLSIFLSMQRKKRRS